MVAANVNDYSMHEVSAIYEPMLTMGWIGQMPSDHILARRVGSAIPSEWCEVVASRTLACGIKISVEQRGLTVYEFDGWAPGAVKTNLAPGFRYVGKISEAAKLAVIWRLRVMNSHLTLLHASSMFLGNQPLPVTRVLVADLYIYQPRDEECDGLWYREMGASLPSSVTLVDRRRTATVRVTTFEMSLDWLDRVIASDALIEFDLLNQAQTALNTHDYVQAVVAGWTGCEFRLRAQASSACIGNSHASIAHIINALRDGGLISQSIADRLHKVRRQRNSWLHSGGEPSENMALEATSLAAELLRVVIPDLDVRPERGFLYL